jgi:Lsr2
MEATMAQRVTVELEDDLDGSPADQTLRFGLGGAEYEIDLGKKNASTFRRQIAPYIEHARRAGSRLNRSGAPT